MTSGHKMDELINVVNVLNDKMEDMHSDFGILRETVVVNQVNLGRFLPLNSQKSMQKLFWVSKILSILFFLTLKLI